MDPNQFSIDLARKFQQFFAHMNNYCQQFLKNQNISEIQTKEKKKVLDPNAPKKPLSPFLYFNLIYRQKVIEKNPEIKLTQLSQMAGNKWQSMTQQEKKPYFDQHYAAKEKYEQELKDYNDKNGIETNDKKNKNSDKFDEKQRKQTLDYNFDDFESKSAEPFQPQQQKKQQQQKQINDDDQTKQQQGKQIKQQQDQKQTPVQTKKIKNVDEIQRDIDQAINNYLKQPLKKSKN